MAAWRSSRSVTNSSAVLLRKLGTYSRKNRLYQAFRELGRVVRTAFLLQFLADQQLRFNPLGRGSQLEEQ